MDADRVFGGSTAEGATGLGVGSVRPAGHGPTVVAPVVPERLDAAERLASILTDAGFDATAGPGHARVLWGKLLINAVINPLTALLGVQNGRLVEIGPAHDLLNLNPAVARGCRVQLLGSNAFAQKGRLTRWVS